MSTRTCGGHTRLARVVVPAVVGVRDVERDDRAQGVAADEVDDLARMSARVGQKPGVIPRLVVHELEADRTCLRVRAREAADVAAALRHETGRGRERRRADHDLEARDARRSVTRHRRVRDAEQLLVRRDRGVVVEEVDEPARAAALGRQDDEGRASVSSRSPVARGRRPVSVVLETFRYTRVAGRASSVCSRFSSSSRRR